MTFDDYQFIGQGEPLSDSQVLIDAHSDRFFSTKDVDNDEKGDKSCSVKYGGEGGWWYKNCHYFNLNGGKFGEDNNHGLKWKEITGTACVDGCLEESAMLIRHKI